METNSYNAPCKNCTDRELNCHGKCDKYKDWQSQHIEELRKRKKEINVMHLSYVADKSKKWLHKESRKAKK